MKRPIATLLAVVVLAAGAGRPTALAHDDFTNMKGRYLGTCSSIYLNFSTINQLYYTLNEKKFEYLTSTPDAAPTLAFRNFVTGIRTTSMSSGVAFVQIDLDGLRVRYMLANTYGASLVTESTLADPGRVREAATWVDRWLQYGGQVATLMGDIESGRLGVAAAWEAVKDARASLYVPEFRAGVLEGVFRRAIDARRDDVARLKAADPRTYGEIAEFQSTFDSSANNRVKLMFEPLPDGRIGLSDGWQQHFTASSLSTAWDAVKETGKTGIVEERQYASMLDVFSARVTRRPGELQALSSVDMVQSGEIRGFIVSLATVQLPEVYSYKFQLAESPEFVALKPIPLTEDAPDEK